MKALIKNSNEHQSHVCAVYKPEYLSANDSNLSLVFITSGVGLFCSKKKTQDDFHIKIVHNCYHFW